MEQGYHEHVICPLASSLHISSDFTQGAKIKYSLFKYKIPMLLYDAHTLPPPPPPKTHKATTQPVQCNLTILYHHREQTILADQKYYMPFHFS